MLYHLTNPQQIKQDTFFTTFALPIELPEGWDSNPQPKVWLVKILLLVSLNWSRTQASNLHLPRPKRGGLPIIPIRE